MIKMPCRFAAARRQGGKANMLGSKGASKQQSIFALTLSIRHALLTLSCDRENFLIAWVGVHLLDAEKLINRTRDWDWLFGVWVTLKIGGRIVAGLTGLRTSVYGEDEG